MAWLSVYREAAGWLVLTQAACVAMVAWLIARARRRQPAVTQPHPAPGRGKCPWCDTRDCLDSTLCNCPAPCGSWLCVDKEAADA